MTGIIKEEILTTIRKLRFIILTVLVFAGAAVEVAVTKKEFFNDLTFYLSLKEYLRTIFNAATGSILIFSVWRRKYTKSSINQAEKYGVKRSTAVIARAASGSIILICCYALMALFVIVLGLISGSHSTTAQLSELALQLATDCIAAVTVYTGTLFWLYLFAFPAVPIAVYCFAMVFMPDTFMDMAPYSRITHSFLASLFVKSDMELFYTGIVFSNPQYVYLLICLAHIVISLFFTALVFKLKKVKDKKKKAKKGGDVSDAISEAAEKIASDPEIKEILRESELTEEIIE